VKVPVRLRRVRRRLTYANVVATLALMIAISGGTAYAASHLITGKQIAKGTISATNIKKHSLTSAVFKKGTLTRGAKGATGPAGAAGAAGPAGPAGTADAYGLIANNANGIPTFNPTLSKGFTTVYSPGTGELCIAAPAGAPTAALIITDESNQTGIWDEVSPAQCGGTGYEVVNASGTALTGELNVALP
jgi:hypothetical protein